MIPYGPGEDPILEKVADGLLERVAPEQATRRPEKGDASPKVWGYAPRGNRRIA
jgi:hypothetical protein